MLLCSIPLFPFRLHAQMALSFFRSPQMRITAHSFGSLSSLNHSTPPKNRPILPILPFPLGPQSRFLSPSLDPKPNPFRRTFAVEEARERRGGDRDRETGGKPSSPSASKELNQERRTAGGEREREEKEKGDTPAELKLPTNFSRMVGLPFFFLSFPADKLVLRESWQQRLFLSLLLLSHFLDIVSRRAEKVSLLLLLLFPFLSPL